MKKNLEIYSYKSKDPNNRLNIPYYRKITRKPFETNKISIQNVTKNN